MKTAQNTPSPAGRAEKRRVCILGSTGSVGRQGTEVVRSLGFELDAICAGSDDRLLEQQIREFSPRYAALADEAAAARLRLAVRDTSVKILSGESGICELAALSDADVVLNSIMGSRGIRPTVAAIASGKDVAMANKEPVVAAGEIILSMARERKVNVIPVDSEHSAIFQCLSGGFNSHRFISRLILTASGGPFYGKKKADLENVTPSQATDHPVWKMGKKISVDSATLMNKGLELIEAVRLFGVEADRVDVTVHRQSVVHSMVEFVDGSVLAQMGRPDMRHCVQFALCWPERRPSLCERLDFNSAFSLTFEPLDGETFPLVELARRAASLGGVYPAVMNAANEAAVALFLDGRIAFTDIFSLVQGAMTAEKYENTDSIDGVLALDRRVREGVFALVGAERRMKI